MRETTKGIIISIVLVLFQMVFSSTSGIIVLLISGKPTDSNISYLIVTICIIISYVASIAIGYAIVGYGQKDFLRIKRISVLDIMFTILLAIGLTLITEAITYMTNNILPVPDSLKNYFGNDRNWLSPSRLISSHVIFPVCETVLFISIILKLLSKHNKAIVVYVLTALLFAVNHFNPFIIIELFILGLAIIWIYKITGSIIAPFILYVMTFIFETIYYLVKHPFLIKHSTSYIVSIIAMDIALGCLIIIFVYRYMPRKTINCE
jgi:membrane protease YdiL (CAAX protease family)